MKRLINIFSFFLALLFVIFALFFGASFFNITIASKTIYIFNSILAILLFVRIFRSKSAIPLLVGYKNYLAKKKKYIYFYYAFLTLSLLLIIPFSSWLVSLSIWLLHSFFIAKSKYYSIEDIYFQNTIFHCFLINLSSHFFSETHLILSLVSFFLANGIIMFSAGIEKIKSPLWRHGEGALSFISLPHLVKKGFHFFHKLPKPIFILVSFLIVFAESTLLFSPLNEYWLAIDLIILIGFSISLFIIVDISFIGQIVTLSLCGIGFLWMVGDFRLVPIASNPLLNYDWTKVHFSIYLLSTFLLVTNGISLLFTFFPQIAQAISLGKIQKFLSGINSPIGVFTEAHQVGFYTYRLVFEDKNDCLQTFCNKGYPSKFQFWHPRYFQAAMYPVTDFCLSWNKYGEPLTNKKEQVIDLLFTGVHLQDEFTNVTQKIYLLVKKFDKGDSIDSYTQQNWVKICSAEFQHKKLLSFDYITTPPVVKTHFRSI
ncbi:hypothetical protein ACE193_23980 [Bernardetia sp. OM2101]|uniref:hypothetical protein n=1 Tax=Bernardetia sp. OM2101 TaxID=3344876 RepID=UPI0035D069C0